MDEMVKILLSAVRESGRAITNLHKTEVSISRKANNDIVTTADLLVNDILKKRLEAAFPDYGWLSEETVDDAQRLSCQRVWVVDPVDGTKEFAAGIPEYAISVALVENGVPVLACVFNPVTDELFHAVKSGGAWLNDQKLHCGRASADGKLLLLASRSEFQRGEWDGFRAANEVVVVGSIAYKLALVAAAKADATFSLGPKSEWDIAAGVLLVEEAGGVVTDQQGEKFNFNSKNVLVNGIIASSTEVYQRVSALIRK
jgi:myo-inositol-1(or 4)-monophosphatase